MTSYEPRLPRLLSTDRSTSIPIDSAILETDLLSATQIKSHWDDQELKLHKINRIVAHMQHHNMLFANSIPDPDSYDTTELEALFLLPIAQKLTSHGKHHTWRDYKRAKETEGLYDINTHDDQYSLLWLLQSLIYLIAAILLFAVSPLSFLTYLIVYDKIGIPDTLESNDFKGVILALDGGVGLILFGIYLLLPLGLVLSLSNVMAVMTRYDGDKEDIRESIPLYVYVNKIKLVIRCIIQYLIFYIISPISLIFVHYELSQCYIRRLNLRSHTFRNIYEMETMGYIKHIIQQMANKVDDRFVDNINQIEGCMVGNNQLRSLLIYIINYKILKDGMMRKSQYLHGLRGLRSLRMVMAKPNSRGFGAPPRKSNILKDEVLLKINEDLEESKDESKDENKDNYNEEEKDYDQDLPETSPDISGDNDTRDYRVDMERFHHHYLRFDMNITWKKFKNGSMNMKGNEDNTLYRHYIMLYLWNDIVKKYLISSIFIQFIILFLCVVSELFEMKDKEMYLLTFVFFGSAVEIVGLIYFIPRYCNGYIKDVSNDLMYIDQVMKGVDQLIFNKDLHFTFKSNINNDNNKRTMFSEIKDICFNKKLIYTYFVKNFGENEELERYLVDYSDWMVSMRADTMYMVMWINKEMKLNEDIGDINNIWNVIIEYIFVSTTKKDISSLFK